MTRLRPLLAMLLGTLVCAAAVQAADCASAPQCCAEKRAPSLPQPARVSVGVVVTGLYNVNEKNGTWDADYYLYESWEPMPGFAPQTEVVNEVARLSDQFDSVATSRGRCIRTRRLRSTLSSPLDLRVFPFDQQRLRLQLSDSWWDTRESRYADRPFVSGVEEVVYQQLSQWEVGHALGYAVETRAFKWEQDVWEGGDPLYDYATFTLPVRRHTTFHLTKFFLPLFVIVLVAMSVFWVDPHDLASQVGIGVTCLLATIAFQLTQATTLPEVAYLTLADLVYVAAYLMIALALAESLYTNLLARRGQADRALRVDALCRWAFPTAFAGLLAASVALSFA
jgi:hypothetical protein